MEKLYSDARREREEIYTISENVTTIGESAFCDCPGLKEIIVSEENANYSSLDGVLFDKDKTVLIQYPPAKSGNYFIPTNVINIGEGAFLDCTGLTNITIPDRVEYIGDWAFGFCAKLPHATIPNCVKTIGDYAFVLCTGLTSVIIPNSVTNIGESAFRGCTGLTSVIISNNVISIKENAFRGCTNLEKFTIPNSVTNIEKDAFANCTGFKEIHSLNPIPPVVGMNGFSGINKTTCKSYIPKGSLSKYRSASGWRDFINIIEKDIKE